MAISRSIVEAVRSMNPPGRFLDKNHDTGLWSDIGDRKAIEKTSQALRDGAAVLRKQLSEDLGDPDFLSVVFESDSKAKNGSNNTAATSDGSASGSSTGNSAEMKKQQQLAQQQQQSASCKPRLMKSRMAKKGHRRVKSVPQTETSASDVKKGQKKARMDQVVPHVPTPIQPKVTPKPTLRAYPSQQPTKQTSHSLHIRSCSYDETVLAATTPVVPQSKRLDRPVATNPVTPSTNRTTAKPPMTYSAPSADDDDDLMDDFCGPTNPWLIGHSRNSSSSSGAYPPFFPMSPIGRHHPQGGTATRNIPNHQHIFSCFQEPRSSGSNHSRPPMSPLHRSWSPRDFQEISPFHDVRHHERHSTGCVTTSFADGDIDIPNLDLSFDRTFDRTFSHDDRAFTMDDDMHMSSILSPRNSEELNMVTGSRLEKVRSGSISRSCTPQSSKDGMEDMDLHYSPTLDCDFTGNKNDLDDVIMKDSDAETSIDRGLSPLSFTRTEGSDATLFETLPDLLHLPIAPCGPYDKNST